MLAYRVEVELTIASPVPVLSPEEAETLAVLLEKLAINPTQMLPARTFFARIKAFPANSSEIALLRRGVEGIEIYLIRRPDNDPFYAGEWHGPGCMLVTNQTVPEGLKDMMVREVGVEFPATYHRFFEWPYGHGHGLCPRGHTVCFYHSTVLSEEQVAELKGGEWFPIDSLPTPLIEVHEQMIGWLRENVVPSL